MSSVVSELALNFGTNSTTLSLFELLLSELSSLELSLFVLSVFSSVGVSPSPRTFIITSVDKPTPFPFSSAGENWILILLVNAPGVSAS